MGLFLSIILGTLIAVCVIFLRLYYLCIRDHEIAREEVAHYLDPDAYYRDKSMTSSFL